MEKTKKFVEVEGYHFDCGHFLESDGITDYSVAMNELICHKCKKTACHKCIRWIHADIYETSEYGRLIVKKYCHECFVELLEFVTGKDKNANTLPI